MNKTVVMIKEFENLRPKERELFFKTPVWFSALVSSSYREVNQTQKNNAIKLAHLRTFTAPPLLPPYYREVDSLFKEELEKTLQEYYPFEEEKRVELQEKLGEVDKVVAKLNGSFAQVLHKSLASYASHVKKSTFSVFRDFIFPITYSRLNDL